MDAQQFAARDQQRQVRTGGEKLRELGRRLDHLLEVVEEEQHLPLADVVGQVVLGAERLGDRLGHERGIAERGQPDPEDAGLELGHELGRSLDRQPRLARAARAGERDETRPVLERERHLRSSRSRPTNELAGRGRLVLEIVLSGGRAVTELVDRDRLGDVLEPVLTEVEGPSSTSGAVACESTTWPPWPDGGDSRPEVNVIADVALVGHQWRAWCRPTRTWIGPRRAPR